MSETNQIIIGVLFLAVVFILTRYGVAWRMRSAAAEIVNVLKMKRAFAPETAVSLPYEKKDWLKIGLRDFKPKTLAALVAAGIVGRTEDGRYYVIDTQAGAMPPE